MIAALRTGSAAIAGLVALGLACPGVAAASSASVPLTIQELLPANDAAGQNPTDLIGRDRTQEPVTSGVPLRDSDGVTTPSQLSVLDTTTDTKVPAQFRVLDRYPSGNARWVLVDVQASVAANQVNSELRVVSGSGPGGSDIAADSGGAIMVDTGAAQFAVRDANQNLLDEARVGGKTLLTSGHSGGVVFEDTATPTGVYESRNDPDSTAVIEENGPLRAVVREQGRLVKADGVTKSLGYTARLTFYKNKAYVKSTVTIENAFIDQTTRRDLTSVHVDLPLNIGSGKQYLLAGQSNELTGTVNPSDSAYVFQGNTTRKANSNLVRNSGRANYSFFQEESDWGGYQTPPNGLSADDQLGYTIADASGTRVPFSAAWPTGAYSRGYGDLSDSTGAGMSVAMRDFDAFFPSDIEFTGSGGASVGIYSKHNTKKLTFDWQTHDSRDMLFDFHATPANAEMAHFRIQYPLFARAPFAQYAETGAILGRRDLVDYQQMVDYHQNNVLNGDNQFLLSNQTAYNVTGYELPNQQIVRYRSQDWSDGGRQNNNDIGLAKLLSFLQQGKGGHFQSVFNQIRYTSDSAVRHSDRADRSSFPVGVNGTGTAQKYVAGGTMGKFEVDFEHENVLAWPIMYYLTGDEVFRDALVDHGEWLLRDGKVTTTVCDPRLRDLAQRGKWFAILSEFVGPGGAHEADYKQQVEHIADIYRCSTLADPNIYNDTGQDQQRGFWWGDFDFLGTLPKLGDVGPTHVVRMEGLYDLWRALPEGIRKDDMQDRLLGTAYWNTLETFFEKTAACRGHNGPVGNTSGRVDLDAAPGANQSVLGIFDHNLSYSWGYKLTKDPRFLYAGRRIVGGMGAFQDPRCPGISTVGQGYATYSGWRAQGFIWADLHQNDFDVRYLDEQQGLDVTNDGGGSYTVSWTVPEGAASYQLKHSPKPMVENLNFNIYTRTFEHDPAQNNNFWGTNGEGVSDQPNNVSGEPQPAAAGARQSYTVTGLDPNQPHHFAMRIYFGGPAPPVDPDPPVDPPVDPPSSGGGAAGAGPVQLNPGHSDPDSRVDHRAPRVTIAGSGRQHVSARRVRVAITVRADETCRLSASGRIAIPGARRKVALEKRTFELQSDRKSKFTLSVRRRDVPAVLRALAGRLPVRAKIDAQAVDRSGNSAVVKWQARLIS